MDTFRVVLEGRCIDGFSVDAVGAGLCRLMRVSEADAVAFLRGKDTTVKNGVDQASGDRYLIALRAIGAACRLEQENLEFDVSSGASSNKTNPVSSAEHRFASATLPLSPLVQSAAIPSAKPEPVSAATENAHGALDSTGTSEISHPKRHFLAKPTFRNIMWLVTCAFVLFAASFVFPKLSEFSGKAVVVVLLSAAVAFVARKLGWQSRYALWLGGAVVGVLLSVGKVKGAAYEMALKNAGTSDFSSYAGLDASRCQLVMNSFEMIDAIFLELIGLVFVSLLWAVSKAFKSRDIGLEYLEAIFFCIVFELGVWALVGALGLLTTIAVGTLMICIAAYFLRVRSLATKFVQKPHG